MNRSGTLVEWNVFSREIKPRLALLLSRHRLVRGIKDGKLVPAVIMVQRISPINLIVLRSAAAPAPCNFPRPFCYLASPPIRVSSCTSSGPLELLHMCHRVLPAPGDPIHSEFTSRSSVSLLDYGSGFLLFFLMLSRRSF